MSPPEAPLPAPVRLIAPERWPVSVPLDSLGLEPAVDWAGGLRQSWVPGERGAHRALERFIGEGLSRYEQHRDCPAISGTSSLSPYLHHGELSPRQVWHAVAHVGAAGPERDAYVRQLGWREFASHLLVHFPETPEKPLRRELQEFPWRAATDGLAEWRRGRTGYPLVDAGMRQLWATGWMHNRVRMVVASFLVKDLLLSWRHGAEWFWDTLVDADLANNTLGWQWSAGCGADAAPYFRIFNPTTQALKFDPTGDYIRKWLPELARLPAAALHQPWLANSERSTANYPPPIVDHAYARERALGALATCKRLWGEQAAS